MKRLVKLSPSFLCLVITGQRLCGEAVSDNFNDNALNRSLWSPISENNTGSILEANQRLEVTGQAAAETMLSGVRLRAIVAGDFDVQIGFTLITNIDSLPRLPQDIGVGIGFGLLFGPAGYLTRGGGDGAGFVEFGYDESRAPASGQSGRLRVTRQGGLYSAYYSSGGTWQLVRSVTSLKSPVQLFIGVGGMGPVTVSAAFDDFRLEADRVDWEVPAAVAIPHLAAGDTWTTELIVANTSDEAREFSINFYDDKGSPLALPTTGVGNVTVLSDTLPAHGTADYVIADRDGPLRTGWGAVSSDSSITVQALFRSRAGSGLYYEAAVPSTAGGSAFVMPFDATTFTETGTPFYTGFAVANLDSGAAANITCTARNGSGALIPNGVSIPPVPPRGHYANYLFPNLAGKRGTLDCSADVKVAALGLRFIGTTAFTSLSVHAK